MGVFAYYDAETEGAVYHVIPSPESEQAPSLIDQESTSTGSRITVQSDDLPGYFVLHHGRQQPASSNIAKWFPSDNLRRDLLRYVIANSVLGGNYIDLVKEGLAPVDGRERRVLELGTRTGTWVQAMAAEFPHVQFRSLDIAPMMAHIPCRNIVFEVYDFTEGLMLEDESQDAVFLNLLLEMVKDYRALVREVYRVLRPGGFVHFNDFNPQFWDPCDTAIPARRTNPRACHLFGIIRQHLSEFGVDPDTCDKLPLWLAPGSDLWDKSQKGFENIHSIVRTYPAHPHEGFPCMDQIDAKIAPYAKHLGIQAWKDGIGLLKDSGIDEETAKRLIDGVLEEMAEPRRSGVVKLYYIYATKIG
ncbi:methyltransferase domain protein [Ceratobasidium sp. AG-Ba]|nr:methyltransferase domain protein [Ceratobasidium sp. AG-Ba]